MHPAGYIVDLHQRRIFPGQIVLEEGKILRIESLEAAQLPADAGYLLPGFIDAHVHIESSMLVPSEFARIAVRHGTVATVSDPHEIANVMGEAGVDFMIENAKQVPFKFYFGAPSCVPATTFETAGDVLDAEAVERLLKKPEIRYLAEMMNYPGVIHDDAEVHAKIRAAHALGLPVDGHAPGLRGEALAKYIAAGISTDHECFTIDEAREKLKLGMKILIREGSAARNFSALIPLMDESPAHLMFCSDDKHPDDLLEGHIDRLVARAVEQGYELFDVLRAACVHPVEHYQLPVGLLRPGEPADFIEVENLTSFGVLRTWIDGQLVAADGKACFATKELSPINRFAIGPLRKEQFRIPAASAGSIRVIEALDGELITNEIHRDARFEDNSYAVDLNEDILKIAVVNRYRKAPPAVAFVKGMGLKAGAIASCVAHDSHNIIAVGTNDTDLRRAVNLIVEHLGGISAVGGRDEAVLPLPVAGIMSVEKGESVGQRYTELDAFAKRLGSSLRAPFMTLSFLALLVIPALKLSDKGLFSGEVFGFVDLALPRNDD